MVGAPETERVGVRHIQGAHLGRQLSARTTGPPRGVRAGGVGPRRIVDLVVDVGHVDDERRLIPLVLEKALEQAENHERPRIADMDAAVHRWAARIDPHTAAVAGLQVKQVPRTGVVQPDIAHGRQQ